MITIKHAGCFCSNCDFTVVATSASFTFLQKKMCHVYSPIALQWVWISALFFHHKQGFLKAKTTSHKVQKSDEPSRFYATKTEPKPKPRFSAENRTETEPKFKFKNRNSTSNQSQRRPVVPCGPMTEQQQVATPLFWNGALWLDVSVVQPQFYTRQTAVFICVYHVAYFTQCHSVT